MKKQIALFGEVLSTTEQKQINGGSRGYYGNACHSLDEGACLSRQDCEWYDYYCDGNVPHIAINLG